MSGSAPKLLTAKPDSLEPTGWKQRIYPCKLSSDLHTCTTPCISTLTHKTSNEKDFYLNNLNNLIFEIFKIYFK